MKNKNKISKSIALILFFLLIIPFFSGRFAYAQMKQTINAIYIPLADHYAGIIAYEKYRDKMNYADYQIERMKTWPLLKARFLSGKVDLAYIMCPLAMDMFRKKSNFRWVGLMHRDGSALAINEMLNDYVNLPKERAKRHPDEKVAMALLKAKQKLGRPTECGVPHLMATHTVVLYKYLKDHGLKLGLDYVGNNDVIAIEVPPSNALLFIKKKNSRAIPASFEQSLPWADVVETQEFGYVAWYSKDILQWPNGHVECITIATDNSIKNKRKALQEVIYYIHKAGLDIETARKEGGVKMKVITNMIRKHIPEHNELAIIQSLRIDLNVINYLNLNIDKAGLKQIMDLAVEGGILREPINIDDFTDESFSTEITK